MDSRTIPLLVVGSLALVIGIVVIVFRRRLRDFTVEGERTMFGRKVGDAAARMQSPFWVGVAGGGGVAIGFAMIVSAVGHLAGAW